MKLQLLHLCDLMASYPHSFKLNTRELHFGICPHQNAGRSRTKQRWGEAKVQSRYSPCSLSLRNLMAVFTFSLNVSSQGFSTLDVTPGNISFHLIFLSLPHSVCSWLLLSLLQCYIGCMGDVS